MIRQLLITALVAAFVSVLSTRLLSSYARDKNQSDVVRVTQLQIVDSTGSPRIVMNVDKDGNARIAFGGATENSTSEIVQARSGETYMQFAGKGKHPSVFLGSGLQVGGPRLELTGNSGPDQRVLLGFTVDDVPSSVSNTWGLFLPVDAGPGYYTGIGAGHVPGEQVSHGFILTTKWL